VTAGGTVSTTSRLLYKLIDLSGYEADIRIRVSLMNTGIFVFDKLGIDPEPVNATQTPFYFLPSTRANEDISYFGPLGALLLLPLLLGYVATLAARRTSAAKGILALALPVIAVELALTYSFNMWIGRFMIVPIALGAALVARVYALRLVSSIFVCFGVAFLAFALLHNERKPVGLDGSKPIWSLNRTAGQARGEPAYTQTLDAIDALVPQTARIGYALADDDWDYPLYGDSLGRRLVRLPARNPLPRARKLGLDWVVIGNVPARSGPSWTGLHFAGTNWDLVAPRGSANARRMESYGRRGTARAPRPI
jgi:hypothetical protein